MTDLTLQLKESFSIISLILVFALLLFDIRYPQVHKELEKNVPDKNLISDRKFFRKKLWDSLLKIFVLILIYGMLIYLFLPLLVSVLQNSKIEFWNFEFIRTAFIIVFCLIAGFFLWSLHLAIRLIKKILECK